MFKFIFLCYLFTATKYSIFLILEVNSFEHLFYSFSSKISKLLTLAYNHPVPSLLFSNFTLIGLHGHIISLSTCVFVCPCAYMCMIIWGPFSIGFPSILTIIGTQNLIESIFRHNSNSKVTIIKGIAHIRISWVSSWNYILFLSILCFLQLQKGSFGQKDTIVRYLSYVQQTRFNPNTVYPLGLEHSVEWLE